jgi:hypothetical protein
MFVQLLYISSTTRPMLRIDVETILFTARRFNQKLDITGLLLSSPSHFMQIMEGEEESVRSAYERICKDPRHHAHVILRETHIEERQFGDWTMASHILRDNELAGAIDNVRAAVADCDVITASYLLGFSERAKAA